MGVDVRDIALSNDGSTIAAVDDGWHIAVWDISSTDIRLSEQLDDIPHAATAGREFFATLAFNDNDSRLAVGCGWAIAVYSIQTNHRVASIPVGHYSRQNGRTMPVELVDYVGSDALVLKDGSIQVVNSSNGQLLWRSPKLPEGAEVVAVSPNERFVATGGGWAMEPPLVRVWDLGRALDE